MAEGRFSDASPGTLVPVELAKRKLSPKGLVEFETCSSRAFVPDPLPPTIDWREIKADLFDEFNAAASALATINGLVSLAPNTGVLRHALWMREAKLSSEIENIHTTALDMVLASSRSPRPERDRGREAWNAMLAVRRALESDLPFCGRLLREMHRDLFAGVHRPDVRPGEFRDVQAWIGPEDRPLEARFVPPPPGSLPGQVLQCLTDLERFANAEWPEIPALACVAMTHYQFETIHPFRDGNGRLGRAMILHQLCERKLLELPVIFVSGYFQRYRQSYVDHMFAVSADGAWKAWIDFFVRGIRVQAIETRLLAERLLDVHRRYSEAIRSSSAPARLLKLLDHLFEWPVVTARSVAELLDVTDPTARKDISTLENIGALRLTEDVGYGKAWYPPEILAVIEATDEDIYDGSAPPA